MGFEAMKHKYSVERLYHFQCGRCAAWWTIGDWHMVKPMTSDNITCPHCGTRADAKKIQDETAGITG